MHHTLYVPVRISEAGFLTLRTGRLESGERIGMAFTSKEALSFTLGSAQQWVNLGDHSLRGMLAPLGIQHLRIDPLPLGQPGTAGIPHQARKRPGPHTYHPVTTAHTTAWAVAFRSLSQHYWQRPAPWMVRGHHKTKIAKGAAAARRPARPAGENGSVLMSGVR